MAAPALRVMEAQARAYRRTWKGSAVTTFVNPVLFLLAMGMGLGTLVDRGAGSTTLEGVTYLEFLAPGLLAATTMQSGAAESSWPVMAGMKWVKTYHAALATPIRARDLVRGHLAWVAIRLTITATAFVLVMVLFGATTPAGGLLAMVPAVLTGMAFAAPITAFTARLETDYALSSLFRFAIMPMFLFSGTFFPVSQLPDVIEPVAMVVPLWHGVELARAAALGSPTTMAPWVHVAYLMAWLVVGTYLAQRAFDWRLVR